MGYEPSSSSTVQIGQSNRLLYDEDGIYTGAGPEPSSSISPTSIRESFAQRREREETSEPLRRKRQSTIGGVLFGTARSIGGIEDMPKLQWRNIKEALPREAARKTFSYEAASNWRERYQKFKSKHSKYQRQREIWRLPT